MRWIACITNDSARSMLKISSIAVFSYRKKLEILRKIWVRWILNYLMIGLRNFACVKILFVWMMCSKKYFQSEWNRLFFRALPDKAMCLKGESCSGEKISIERITVMLYVHMEGDFETPLVNRHSLRLWCFKNIIVNDLGKTWMTQKLMKE